MAGTSSERIVKTPGTCGTELALRDTACGCRTLLSGTGHQDMTPDQVVSDIPTITLSDFHSAPLAANACV